jgi:ribonuclease Z
MFAKGRGHSTTIEAAKVAAKAEAKRLIIGHFSSRYKSHEPLVEECRTIFPNSDIAAEGMTFNIEEKR